MWIASGSIYLEMRESDYYKLEKGVCGYDWVGGKWRGF